MAKLNHMLEKRARDIELPEDGGLSDRSRRLFRDGMDKVNEYRGDANVLFDAVSLFGRTQSADLFQTGMAYAQNTAAYIEGGRYDAEGLRIAQNWLSKVSADFQTSLEYLTVKAFVLINRRDLSKAHSILMQIRENYSADFFALTAEMMYFAAQENTTRLRETQREVLKLALITTRKIYALKSISANYLQANRYEDALSYYKQLIKLSPNDPWMWHNMSIAYMLQDRLQLARECNQNALAIMSFDNALRIKKRLQHLLIRKIAGAVMVAALVLFAILNLIF